MTGVWIVDAFTSVPFRGNAAGVCLLDAFPDDATMQRIAAQINLSETAFVVSNGKFDFGLRWFTPEVEVNLCGHATLAATHVLRQTGMIKSGDRVTFQTLSGELSARAMDNVVELNFPMLPGTAAKPPAALKALGVDMLACERNEANYLVEVKDYDVLLECKPHFKQLARLDAQGVIVTTATGIHGYDFASRYFAPGVGINEDPVTGSAHCFLAPYWSKKLSKIKFHAYQASKGKGVLDVTIAGDRVLIAGNAVTTLKGDMQFPTAKNKGQAPC